MKANQFKKIKNSSGDYSIADRREMYNQIPSRIYNTAVKRSEPFRLMMVAVSLNEYDENPHYKSVINKWYKSIIGPMPSIIAMSDNDDDNNSVEDRYKDWGIKERNGFAYREMARMAALTGIGIAIPANIEKSSNNDKEIGLTYKIYGTHHLKTPPNIPKNTKGYDKDYLHQCIQYDKNWNIVGFWIEEKFFEEKDVLYWYLEENDGKVCLTPPCGQAFSIYPAIKRIINAIVKGEEFRSAMPMAVEVEAQYWGAAINKEEVPTGTFEYEPGFIPTLPPGTRLVGTPGSANKGVDQERIIRLVANSAALSIDMPANLALSDSSNSNMATAQVDMQPWILKVDIDRFDFQFSLLKSFDQWFQRGIKIDGYFTPSIRSKYRDNQFPFEFGFQKIFNHPDPNKVSNSRMTDLQSGFGTLSRFYSEHGMNAKRELKREANLFGLEFKDYVQIILTARNNYVQQGIYDDNQTQNQ